MFATLFFQCMYLRQIYWQVQEEEVSCKAIPFYVPLACAPCPLLNPTILLAKEIGISPIQGLESSTIYSLVFLKIVEGCAEPTAMLNFAVKYFYKILVITFILYLK